MIDADALDWERIEYEHGARHEAVVDCEQMVGKAPTIDPVRHGRWISDDIGFKCTSCGSHDESTSIYCPNCGAKMDEEENDGNW